MLTFYLMAYSKKNPTKVYPALSLNFNEGDTKDNFYPLLIVHNPFVSRPRYLDLVFYQESSTFTSKAITTMHLMREIPRFSRVAKEIASPNFMLVNDTSKVNEKTETFIIDKDNPRMVYDLLKFLPTMFPGSFFIKLEPYSSGPDPFEPQDANSLTPFSLDEILEELLEKTVIQTAGSPGEMAAHIVDLTRQLEKAQQIIAEQNERIRAQDQQIHALGGTPTSGVFIAWQSVVAPQSVNTNAGAFSSDDRVSPPNYDQTFNTNAGASSAGRRTPPPKY